jgi:predicted aspartyl protease
MRPKTMKILLLVIAAMVGMTAVGTLVAQQPQRMRLQGPPPGAWRMESQDGSTIVPFELLADHVVIPVNVNGQPLKLILDTGMPVDGVLLWGSQRVEAAELEYAGKSLVMGPGGNPVESDLAMGVMLEVPGDTPGIEFTGQMAIVMPEDTTRIKHFEGTDGVIGQSLFSNFVVAFDYDSLNITLTEPERFDYAGEATPLPMRIERYPFVEVELGIKEQDSIPLELVIDTGNGAALTLNAGAQDGLGLPEKVVAYKARSVSGEIERAVGRIDHFRLGPFVLEDVLVSFRTPEHEPPPPWAKAGALGQGILRRFNVVFDYSRERLILEPNHFFDTPSELNMAGIQFVRAAVGALKITHVITDSPAGEMGLLEGDHIDRINGRSAGDFSLEDLDRLFKQEGKEVILGVHRSDQVLTFRIELRRLI